jgi:transglutaminase-like putative cysteine protease
MSWRISVDHETKYTYKSKVGSQHNEIRMAPRDTEKQFTLEHNLIVEPAANISRYKDYFGTRVASFAVAGTHDTLVINSHSLVETTKGAAHHAKSPMTWDSLKSEPIKDKFCEYLSFTSYVDQSEQYEWLIKEILNFKKPGLAVEFLMDWLRKNVSYIPGSTNVGTIASTTMVDRAGVCQDFVHLSLALLRTVGIPCRYVSGYLYPGESEEIGEVVNGESHAWLQVWLGDWYGVDPTNDIPVAQRHVVVGWGRDYSDVAPVKGIINGDPECDMEVKVKLVRVS